VSQPLLWTFLAYLLGATPSALLVGKGVFGVDLRRTGSGNLGATNAFRVLGIRAAAPVLCLDVLKGWIPVALFPIAGDGLSFGWTLAFGGAAILGHMFSFWVGFGGGKGVATSAGVFLALAPWALGVALAVWIVALLTTGYVSLGSILAALVLTPAVLLTPHQGGSGLVAFALGLSIFILWAHRQNARRLLRGEELRFRFGRGREEEGA